MRVLLISHTCQSAREGQPRAHALARYPDLELKVLVPDRWFHVPGRWFHPGTWRYAEHPVNRRFTLEAGRVQWPWLGPAQFYMHWYPDLRRVLREFKPDIIDLWEEAWGLVSVHACRLRDEVLPKAKVICETEQNVYKKLPVLFERFRRYTLGQADYAVARNQEAISVIGTQGYHGDAEVVPNAVDEKLFRPMDRAAARQAFGVHGYVVGYVGRLVVQKGLLDLVDALAACPPQVNVLLVGEGPFQRDIEQRARERGVTSRMRFLPNQPMDRVPQVMNALDVLALPSWTTERWKEQFGRVIIEAHACELPVIGSASGAIPEVIGKGGLVVPERNPAALAAAIQELCADREKGRAMGVAGRQRVESNYTWDRVAERFYRIYRKVLGR